MDVTRVQTARCRGGEGPLWDPVERALYFIDNAGQKVHRYEPASGTTRSWDVPSVVTSLVLRQRGGGIVTLRTGIHTLDFQTGALEFLAELPPRCVFNDGKVDRRGRFIIGGCTSNFHRPAPDGGVYRMGADHHLTVLDTGVHFSNGPCWSPDDKTFYFSDSFQSTTYSYDYDIETGGLANKRIFVNTHDLGGVPDGATVDRDGLVWIAIFRGGKIAAYRPNGQLERIVELPVRLTSSVMFGGPNLDQLYVTTIAKDVVAGTPEEPEEGAGHVFVINGLGARGVPEPKYAG